MVGNFLCEFSLLSALMDLFNFQGQSIVPLHYERVFKHQTIINNNFLKEWHWKMLLSSMQ